MGVKGACMCRRLLPANLMHRRRSLAVCLHPQQDSPRLSAAVGKVAGRAFSALAIPAPQILLMTGSDGLYSHGGVPAELNSTSCILHGL